MLYEHLEWMELMILTKSWVSSQITAWPRGQDALPQSIP